MISPNIMSLALKYKIWKEGYRWTEYIQIFILVVCFATLPLWNTNKKEEKKDNSKDIEDKKENSKENEDKKESSKQNDEKNENKDEKKEIEESNNRIIKINVNKIDNEIDDKIKEGETKEEFEKKEIKNKNDKINKEEEVEVMTILEVIKIKDVVFSYIAFFLHNVL